MSTNSFNENIMIVINALKKAGYNSYDQLYGYVTTGEITYITRQGNARKIIEGLDKNELREYVTRAMR